MTNSIIRFYVYINILLFIIKDFLFIFSMNLKERTHAFSVRLHLFGQKNENNRKQIL